MIENIKKTVDDFLSKQAIEYMKESISLANDNEVFFIGKLEEGVVVDVEAVARGSKSAVPAIMEMVQYGDVVIHNHPTGHLDPSEADLSIATKLASGGAGNYIVNNDVSDIYVVVNAFAKKEIVALDKENIISLLSQDGFLSKVLPNYELRPQQIEMAVDVIQAFNENKVAVVEAGTGTGKSLAYLLPSIQWALQNKERVVISTNTINLQQQLIQKDIPFLEKKLGLKFKSVLIKGRGNYLCLRKAEFYKNDIVALDEEKDNSEFASILKWIENTADGSVSDINPPPSDETWEKVSSDQDQCLRVRCSHFEKCYFYNARREAAQANILIANHHILMADIALRFQTENYVTAAVLPPFQRIIFDEAHNLEDVATSYFGSSVSKTSLSRLLNKLSNPKKEDKGYLSHLTRHVQSNAFINMELCQKINHKIQSDLLPFKKDLQEFIVRNFNYISDAVQEYTNRALKIGEDEKLRITNTVYSSALWKQNIYQYLKSVIDEMNKFIRDLKALLKMFDQIPKEHRDKFISPVLNVRSIQKKLSEAVSALSFFISDPAETEGYCKWCEIYKGKNDLYIKFDYSPIIVGNNLKKAIYDSYKTVIMTSATLTVKNSFDFLTSRIGLDLVEKERIILKQLETPFDYEKQVFCAVPIDISFPSTPKYDQEIRDFILKSIAISEGRAFVLFTSYRLMDKIFQQTAPIINKMNIQCLKQGIENRDSLLRKFKEDPTSVLFATSSFWEGVDVPGRALECLILTKLPFKVPTEPVLEARVEYIDSHGGDSFMEFTVPLAVIKFKQGFGRLIRNRQDYGAVLILDKRVVSKAYGKMFLQSLPISNILISNSEEIFKNMNNFFNERN